MAGFKRLTEFVGERVGRLLTIRATETWLIKEPVKTLWVRLQENSEILTSSKERKAHFQTASLNWLEKQLKKWNKPEISKVRIATPEHPLEVVTSDVCLILEIEDKEYIVSFYRDILPQGWLIPGGCPRNLEEVLNPKFIAIREVCEEVLIGDIEGRVYSFYSTKVELEENCQSWNLEPREIVSVPREELSLEKGDAQNLVIRMGERETRMENVSITVDPQTASVSVTLYWRVKLPIKLSELRIFDGEKREKDRSLLNRPVRLTNEEGDIAAIFVHGQNILSADWITPRTRERATAT